jgi:hypothetical protein
VTARAKNGISKRRRYKVRTKCLKGDGRKEVELKRKE